MILRFKEEPSMTDISTADPHPRRRVRALDSPDQIGTALAEFVRANANERVS
jgi:hypothetical protein